MDDEGDLLDELDTFGSATEEDDYSEESFP
jgi:hypothetical protein